jgi:MFS family permease
VSLHANLKAASRASFSRDARLLLAVSGISAVSFFGIHVLLKVIYVLRLGYGPAYVGAFTAAGALTYMGMGVPSGALGARWGNRRMMLIGGVALVLGMAAMPMAAFVHDVQRSACLMASQVVTIVGWSLFNVNLTPALKAVTAPAHTEHAFAVSGALRGVGMLAGTLAGGLLPGWFARLMGQPVDTAGPYRWAMWVGAAVAGLALAPLLFVREGTHAATEAHVCRYGRFPLRSVALTAVYVYLSQAGWGACHAFFNAYADTDLFLSTAAIAVITGVGQVAAIVAPLLMPQMAARTDTGSVLVLTTLGIGAGLAPLALIAHPWVAGLGRVTALAAWSAWFSMLQTFQMERVDERWRTLAFGVISMAMGFGFGSMSIAGGYAVAAWGYRTLFGIGVAASILGAMWMWAVLRWTNRRQVCKRELP